MTEDHDPRTEDRRQRTEGRGPRTEDGGLRTAGGGQKAEDRGRRGKEARREAVQEAIAKAHNRAAAPCERREPSDERRAPPPCCRHCMYATEAHDDGRPVWVCANTPARPGEIVCVKSDGACPNFRRKRPPVVRTTPPQPPNDKIRYIPLTQGKYAIVDAADYEWLRQYKWCASAARGRTRIYAYRKRRGRNIYMHREIMQPPPGMLVDHISGPGLNNSRKNLRNCTPQENVRNRGKYRGLSSRFKGVYRCPHGRKWRSAIGLNGHNVHLGTFDHELEAARAYDRKALEHFGPFARLNLPDEWPPEKRREVYVQFGHLPP